MTPHWTTVYEGHIGDRLVKVMNYSEGGLKVLTTQPCDEPGFVEADGDSTLIFPPYWADQEIEVEGETPQELETNLIQQGYFSREEAKQVISLANL